jgi:hypothetical protein
VEGSTSGHSEVADVDVGGLMSGIGRAFVGETSSKRPQAVNIRTDVGWRRNGVAWYFGLCAWEWEQERGQGQGWS